MIFQLLGGLGIFLFSINYMGDGLQKAAGDRLRDILDKYTTNPLMGIIAGALVTALIQSSSGTTVLTVGLVSAGFMSLRQAIGVIMGANIGTTITAFIIGINLSDYALPIMAVGAAGLFFFKSQKVKHIGQILFGFGGLFFGLELMGTGMRPLVELPWFSELFVSMSGNPVLSVGVGAFVTAILQSSSAAVGILQELYGQGSLDIHAALPILFGSNIGTTITVILASIGASVVARRTAATHVLFNLIGSIIFLIILSPFTNLIIYLRASLDLNLPMTIAVAHGIFNITNTFILYWFIGLLADLVTKLVPEGEEVVFKANHLDPIFIEQSPSVALGQAKEEVLRMAEYAEIGLASTKDYLLTKKEKYSETTLQIEETINTLDRNITEYLIELTAVSLSPQESEEHYQLLSLVRDFERVGDHFENIIEQVQYQITRKGEKNGTVPQGLIEMFDLTMDTLRKAVIALKENDIPMAKEVLSQENIIDQMERKFRKRSIQLANEGDMSAMNNVVYADIVSNLERIGDYAVNIAESVMELNPEKQSAI